MANRYRIILKGPSTPSPINTLNSPVGTNSSDPGRIQGNVDILRTMPYGCHALLDLKNVLIHKARTSYNCCSREVGVKLQSTRTLAA